MFEWREGRWFHVLTFQHLFDDPTPPSASERGAQVLRALEKAGQVADGGVNAVLVGGAVIWGGAALGAGGLAISEALIPTTAHGLARVGGAALRGGTLGPGGVLVTKLLGTRLVQADGAQVFVRAVGTRFNVVVEGSRGIITTFQGIDARALANLAAKYGWR